MAREVMRQLPDERIVYFGDTARLPYGTKSQDTVIRFSEQIMRFLRSKGVKAIVIACNTASSYALDAPRRSEDIPIIGVINAGARAAVSATKNREDRSDRDRRDHQQQSVFLCFKKHESGGGGIRKGLPPVRSSGGGGASPRYCDGRDRLPVSVGAEGKIHRYPGHGLYPLSSDPLHHRPHHGRRGDSGESGL